MKNVRNLLVVLLTLTTLAACKKDKQNSFIVEGSWEGKIGNGVVTPTGQLALNLLPQGQLERINSSGNIAGTGTWTLSGDTFNASYTLNSGTVVILSGTLDKGQSRISGNWSNDGDETGTWFVTKEQ